MKNVDLSPETALMVRVVWVDAEGEDGWTDPEDFEKWAKEELTTISSVGWLVYENKDHLVLAASIGGIQVMHGVKIPRRWILEFTVLKEDESGNIGNRGSSSSVHPSTVPTVL